jgi:hypothetical protein
MRKFVLILLASLTIILGAASPLFSKERKPVAIELAATEVERSLFSGNESSLGGFGWLRFDSPAHGEIRFEEVTTTISVTGDSLNATSAALKKKCDGKPANALRLMYKAPEDFTGKDVFVLDMDTKLGYVKRYAFTVNIR